MKKDKKAGPESWEDEGIGEWIVTYADMVTLLLTFFIMLFSISALDAAKFKEIVASIQKGLGQQTVIVEVQSATAPQKTPIAPKPPPPPPRRTLAQEDLYGKLLKDVQTMVRKKRLGEYIVIQEETNRLVIRVVGHVLFDSGQAELNPQSYPILDDIAQIIQDHPKYRVNIKGYTDDRPISTVQFPSNWELSAVRATTVLRYMVSKSIDPGRMTGTGYGDLMPLAPNDSPENRAKNRRVEFVLEKEEN
ncbi:MAG: OmpA family protein [Proteobacteria bacterium]|nr:OmpA family protein [Pseudomonadota bacterium]